MYDCSVLCLSLFCYSFIYVHSSFAILKRKRKLVALLLLFYRYVVTINVLWLFLTVPWVCLQYMLAVFPDHTRVLFNEDVLEISGAKRYQGIHYATGCTGYFLISCLRCPLD